MQGLLKKKKNRLTEIQVVDHLFLHLLVQILPPNFLSHLLEIYCHRIFLNFTPTQSLS